VEDCTTKHYGKGYCQRHYLQIRTSGKVFRPTRYFFVTGLLRSRTAWLANLFSTERTHCFHELLSISNPERIEAFKGFAGLGRYEYLGSADTNPPVVRKILGLFPVSPIVVVHRNIEEVCASIAKYAKALNKRERIPFEKRLSVIWDGIRGCQQDLLTIGDSPQALNVAFAELENNQVVERIWNHCISTIEPDPVRIMQLQNMRILVKNRGMNDLLEYADFFLEFIKRKVV